MTSFYFFDTLSSTMDEARSRVLQGIEEGSVIVAIQQSNGRGRRGRAWESPPGNLYLTYITYAKTSFSKAPQLSFVACVAAGQELRSILPPTHSLTYKWPNDLLLNGKKVGGFLLEAVEIPTRNEIGYLIGCGLNLKTYPDQVRYPATTFQSEGIYLSLEEVLLGLSSSLQRYISLWQKEEFPAIQALWMEHAANLGKEISVDFEGQLTEGIFEGIDEEGLLVLKTSKGRIKLMAGEILSKVSRAACY
ncbi:MAG: biotin--[acetyl-CoA-carboxylase] ligase [Proteobacteria bacterium]|nr:biotin--[acetyl-CoA-carboxylase] ligase [Pseudomonadota bacterium]